jgi:hypothetical protein
VLCISRNKHWRYISSYHVSVPVTILCSSPFTSHISTLPALGSLASAPYRAPRLRIGFQHQSPTIFNVRPLPCSPSHRTTLPTSCPYLCWQETRSWLRDNSTVPFPRVLPDSRVFWSIY